MAGEAEVRAYRDTDFSDVNRLFARRLLGIAGKQGGRALDIGTGPAEIPLFLCEMAPRWRVTAVDASDGMLDVARAKVRRHGLEKRIRIQKGDAKSLRGLRRPFDLVFSNGALHHISDPISFWREVRRLLVPGGRVMVQDLLRPRTRAEARRLVRLYSQGASRLLKRLFLQSFLAAYTPAEVRAQLEEAGISGWRVRKASDRHVAVFGRLGKRSRPQGRGRSRLRVTAARACGGRSSRRGCAGSRACTPANLP
jgi:ubiquinone/menaquinone biosynthesis C-methylase UbiE